MTYSLRPTQCWPGANGRRWNACAWSWAAAVRRGPARAGGLLDQWWARLAERLNGETRLPALPGEVSQAFVTVWQQAIHLAQGVAEQALAEQRQVLIAEHARVAAVEDQARQDAAQCRQQAAEALAGRQSISAIGNRQRHSTPVPKRWSNK